MGKFFVACAFLAVFASCGNDETSGAESPLESGADAKPLYVDTTIRPNGVTNGSVISTDTSAMTLDSVPNP